MSPHDKNNLALRHIGVIGDNLKSMQVFYKNLGFSDCISSEICYKDYIGVLTGGAWDSAEIVKLNNIFGDTLELICPTFSTEGKFVNTSWSHIAVTIHEDINSVIDLLLEHQAKVVGGPINSANGPYTVCYIRDPWGNLIELTSPLHK